MSISERPAWDVDPIDMGGCTECGHSQADHAYSDDHSQPDWMNDDGSINYATHCHAPHCRCSDWNHQGRPRAERLYPEHG